MSNQKTRGDSESTNVGVDPDAVEENDDCDVARELGFDVGAVDPDAKSEDVQDLVELLTQRDDVDPVVATVLETLVETVDRQQDELEDLREQQEKTHDVATTAVAKAQSTEQRVDDVEEQEEKTRDIARSAVAKAEQVDADPDQQEDAEDLPAGVEPSTSPLDFFANCRQQKIKEMFVEDSNRSNTFRAVAIAKRWREFAHERSDGSGIFWTREDVETALTAQMGETPHRMTVKRVWETLRDELGGDDVLEKSRRISSKQEPKDILGMDVEAAEKLNESRYIGMDLLDGSEGKARTGGVTPVVTGEA